MEVLTVLGVAILLMVIWLFSSKPPHGFSQPWKYRLYSAPIKIIRLYSWFQLQLGGLEKVVESIKGAYCSTPADAVSDTHVKAEDMEMDGVRVRVFSAEARQAPSPALVYYHGGGFIAGDVGLYDPTTRMLAKDLGIVVVSVAYRLAPEFPFPTPMEDCYNATVHFLKHAQEFGVDPKRIGIAGDSAGGNLAAAVALKLRNQKVSPPAKLSMLIYPMLQACDLNLPSFQLNSNEMLEANNIVMFWALYAQGHVKNYKLMQGNQHTSKKAKQDFYTHGLNHDNLPEEFTNKAGYVQSPDDFGDEKVWNSMKGVLLNPYFSPLMAKDLRSLPKTYVLTVGADVLRDDGFLYVKRLQNEQNDVTHFHYEAGFHGMFLKQLIDIYEDAETVYWHVVEYLKSNLF